MSALGWFPFRGLFRGRAPGGEPDAEEPQPVRRVRWVARVLAVWALVLLGRLVELQLLRHDDFRRLALSQQQKVIEIEAPRGMILDRNLKPLAMSLPVDSVCVNPQKIPDVTVAADILSSVLSIDRDELQTRLLAAKQMQRGFLWIKRKITPEESARLRSFNLQYVEFRQESHRFYPKGKLAAQVVGAVGMLDREERGVVGLEAYFEDELEGRPGVIRLITDSKQRGLDSYVSSEPAPGQDVVCTIDERIQFVAERELARAVVENHCKTGSVVVLDPKNGDVLAMASYPTFDPNERLKKGEDLAPRLNLAISAPFEPGSVFKVITLAAALERTSLRPDSMIYCGNGVINLFGRTIHDHDPYGWLSMTDVLARSSNVGAIQVGLKVGEQTLYEYVRKFGFGSPTGIELPAESSGMVRRLKAWSKSSIGSVAMGHEISATTLQLAQACAIVANGGVLVRPRIVLRCGRSGARFQSARQDKPQVVLTPENAVKLQAMMEEVVKSGTGKKAQLDGYRAAGKTGSAQIFDFDAHAYTHRYNASFMGFAPVTNPAVVVVVTLNGASQYGGAVAAPVFREVASAALRILDVPRDPSVKSSTDREGGVNDLPAANLGDAPDDLLLYAPQPNMGQAKEAETGMEMAGGKASGARTPDFLGKSMRDVFQQAAARGIPVQATGRGVVKRQLPPPGAILTPGASVWVELGR